jgi:hypothetical protein
MAGKCANRACSVSRPQQDEGKLFRVDVGLGNTGGKHQQKTKTLYLWLCGECAQQMHPKVEVSGDRVQVRLGKIAPALLPAQAPGPRWIN